MLQTSQAGAIDVPPFGTKCRMNHILNRVRTRRAFIKTATYVAPAIVTLSARFGYAQPGSGNSKIKGNNGDGPGTGPGNPGNKGGAKSKVANAKTGPKVPKQNVKLTEK